MDHNPQLPIPVFPWFTHTWQQLIALKKQRQLPSSLLLAGPAGIGKKELVEAYAQYVLCRQEGEYACGSCRSCVLLNAGNHPDVYRVVADNDTIKIDQIRQLVSELSHTPVLSRYQVAIIFLAEQMNRAAANALLKTLEEPRGNVLILLTSNQPSLLPATIRSRCFMLKLPLPQKNMASAWLHSALSNEKEAMTYLALADGLPLKALSFAKEDQQATRLAMVASLLQLIKGELDPISAASSCQLEPQQLLEFLLCLLMDLIKIHYGTMQTLTHINQLDILIKLAAHTTTVKLFQFVDNVMDARQLLINKANVNLQLLTEQIFIEWRYL